MATIVDPSASGVEIPAGDAVPTVVSTDKPNQAHPETGFDMSRPWSRGLDWPTTIWIATLHLGALAAPFYFTWTGLVMLFVFHWMTGGLGICLGYHRLLTHNSFKTYYPFKFFIAMLGGLAGEGSAVRWVAMHRKHHAYSDLEGDPHSPHNGPWWSHILWLLPYESPQERVALLEKWAPDLARDRGMVFLDYAFLPINLAAGAILFAIGMYWDVYTATSFVVYGIFLRLVYVLHATWLVNSASHMWGYRNYTTTDDSRNNWWVAVITYGEGWHNNHHAHPRMANHGHQWWEIDVTYTTIRLMEMCGLAWDIARKKAPKHREIVKS